MYNRKNAKTQAEEPFCASKPMYVTPQKLSTIFRDLSINDITYQVNALELDHAYTHIYLYLYIATNFEVIVNVTTLSYRARAER